MAPTKPSEKRILKVIVLGDSGVGKTCLIRQYVNKQFSLQFKATIGADFLTKEVQIDDRKLSLQLWDTAGQERFNSLGPAFFRGADCCVLVYDVTNRQSFEALQYWRDSFIKQAGIPNPLHFPFIVIGNKIDVNGVRAVSEKEAKLWCIDGREDAIPYFETSAKENVNVEDAFLSTAKAAFSRDITHDYYDNLPDSISDFEPKGVCAC